MTDDRCGGDSTAFGTAEFLGQRFALFDQAALLAYLRARAAEPVFSYVVTPNTDHIVRLDKIAKDDLGSQVSDAYARADLRICDSRVLGRLARVSGIKLDVLAGSDLTRLVFETHTVRKGDRVALIGGDADQLEWLRAYRPDVVFLGYVPPMGILRNAQAQLEAIEFIERAACNFYFLSFGAPQSELIAAAVKRRDIAQGVALCVGASIEFLSGTKKRAPPWIQRLSLEWAYRLATEPQRLWRRYLVDGPRIFALWRRQHVSRRGNPPSL